MPVIAAHQALCTVIVTVDAEPEVMDVLEGHARGGLIAFREFRGFVSGALHKSTDGRRLVQYLQWASEADHLACMHDARWDDDPSARAFMNIVASGEARIDVRVYHVVAATDGGDAR